MKFCTNVIEENTNNQCVLFSCFEKMLNTSAAKKLPTQCIRASFSTTTADPVYAEQLYHGPEFHEFSPTPIELSSHVKSMVKKSCSLDPIPGSLMKDSFSVLLPVIVNMISLLFKEAFLDPVIEKDSLDHEIYQNFRPISNLRFVSKATEKVVWHCRP